MMLADSQLMRLAEIMSLDVLTVEPTEQANTAWTILRQNQVRYLVVTSEGHIHGIISDRDLGGPNGSEVRKNRLVEDLMVPQVFVIQQDANLRSAVNLMRRRLIGSLPVLDGDKLVGIVTATDVFDHFDRGAHSLSVTRGARTTPRRRPVKADGSARAAFATQLSHATHTRSGRAEEASLMPAFIYTRGTFLSEETRDYIRRKLGMKLGKFAKSIERVSVRLEDINGPRGGVDQACRIKVVLHGLSSEIFESRQTSLGAAIDTALTGVERAVRRSVRRRQKPARARRRDGEGSAQAA